MNLKMKKVAVAVAAGLCVSLVGTAEADEVMFPYVASSNTVTTILSVVNTKDPTTQPPLTPYTLHWRYEYKSGNGTDPANNAKCVEHDTSFSSSQNDLVDVDVDATFGSATRGVLFNDPSTNANYAPTTVSLALLAGIPKAVRAFAVVDNNSGGVVGPDNTLTAARATVLEFVNGAAWGYDAYNPVNTGSSLFSEDVERFGEVFGPFVSAGNGAGNALATANISFKPTDEWSTIYYITPIQPDVAGTTQIEGNLTTEVALVTPPYVTPPYTGVNQPTLGVVDRDENIFSGGLTQVVTCVGAVRVTDMLGAATATQLADTGGWSTLQVSAPFPASSGSSGNADTGEATVLFLEHNATGPNGAGGGTLNGEPFPGVVNNGYMLREQ